MDEIIKEYLEESEAFSKMFGKEGPLAIDQSDVHSRLLDISARWDSSKAILFDAQDLREIGVRLVILANKLKEGTEKK